MTDRPMNQLAAMGPDYRVTAEGPAEHIKNALQLLHPVASRYDQLMTLQGLTPLDAMGDEMQLGAGLTLGELRQIVAARTRLSQALILLETR
jgi:hypothetical protein